MRGKRKSSISWRTPDGRVGARRGRLLARGPERDLGRPRSQVLRLAGRKAASSARGAASHGRGGEPLSQLARAHGIQLSYQDMEGQEHRASQETLKALLGLWGVSAHKDAEVRAALRELEQRKQKRVLPPVLVVWDHQPLVIKLRLHAASGAAGSFCLVRFEDGRCRALGPLAEAAPVLRLPRLPFGYHELEWQAGGQSQRALLISAPSRSYSPPGRARQWGAFLPLYALRSNQSWGAGNLGDWARLSRWVASLGGGVMATLPLTAVFLGQPCCEPSPYSPASRLFWNEFYLDIIQAAEFERCPAARRLVRSARFQKEVAAFQREPLVGHCPEAALRRRVLELLADAFFARGGSSNFEDFLQNNPRCSDYAEFRATCDTMRAPWSRWEERLRHGKLQPGDYREGTKRYYLYSQWLMEQQMAGVAGGCSSSGTRLLLDLPLGVHPDSYDLWREREAFASLASVGAPPDVFFTRGQNWGFPPPHPERIRESGYAYFREYLKFHLRHAGMLRLDHIMGLHRLYWIPPGFPADAGAYVSYAAEEFQAILCLESHRHQTLLVGENLGTVPAEVNAAMDRHRFRKIYVAQFQQTDKPRKALEQPPVRSLASLNTHDTPTFASHWRGLDLQNRAALGLLTPRQLKKERARRTALNRALLAFLKRKGLLETAEPRSSTTIQKRSGRGISRGALSARETHSVLRACLRWLAASPAELVLVNLEDLWLEERPQNVPGTCNERPNWRRKAALTLEQMQQSLSIRRFLTALSRCRASKRCALNPDRRPR